MIPNNIQLIDKRNEEAIRAIEKSREQENAVEAERHEEVVQELKGTNNALGKINEELVQANETLRIQLSAANSNLKFILNSIGSNSQKLQVEAMKTNIELAKLKTILEFKDEKGIKNFISEHGIESVGLILQAIGMFIGK